MATKLGEKMVLRLAERQAALRSLDSLGFSTEALEAFRTAVAEPNGIVLVTGPTGSGKSTTLYGALAELINGKRNLCTIEDPVERRLPGANQFQVSQAAGFTFAKALRALLRQDPDTIMLGEIRDAETATLATEAALTGHLVLSTLHTNDAATAIPRLINMGVQPYLVAATLRGVLAQRLVRKLCAGCAKPAVIPDAQHRLIERLGGGELANAFIASGCAKCRGQGYVGRIGVYEFLPLNEAILSEVTHREGPAAIRLLAESRQSSLLQDGLTKVAAGQITLTSLFEIVSKVQDSTFETTKTEIRAA